MIPNPSTSCFDKPSARRLELTPAQYCVQVLLLTMLAFASPAWADTGSAQSAPDTSDLAWVRDSATIDAPPDRVLAALQAPCAVRQWLSGVDELDVLAHPAKNQTLVYLRQNLPWPWNSRDVVSRFTVQRSDDGRRIDVDQVNVPDYKPPTAGVVRVPRLHAHWTLQAQGKATRVDYRQRIDLGGHVAQWMTNRAAGHLVAKSMSGLKTFFAQPADQQCIASKSG